MSRTLLWIFTGLFLAALGVLLVYSGADVAGANLSGRMQEHFFLRAVEESGAINLVSAIYLGYRAFDTLGETIVLVLSVAGVLLLTGERE